MPEVLREKVHLGTHLHAHFCCDLEGVNLTSFTS